MKRSLILVAAFILFIELLDTTILYSCFLPIAHDFGINASRLSFAILSYIVGTCIFIPAVSWLSKKYNQVNIIIIALIIFSIFSILCGFSQELYEFSVFRFFQGVFISIAAATIFITLLSSCHSNEIVRVMSAINIPALLGTAVGPFLGAIFSYYVSWRLSFFVNFPICLILVLVLIFQKNNINKIIKEKVSKSKLDWLGFFLTSFFLILLSVGLEQLTHTITIENFLIVFFGIILGGLYIFVWFFRKKQFRETHSILDLTAFKNKDFLLGASTNIIARSAMCGVPLLINLILQQAYAFSILKSGLYLSMIAVAGVIAKFFSSFINRIGIYKAINGLVLLTSFSIFSLSPIEFWVNNGYLWLICFVFGFTMSLLYTAMNSVMYISASKESLPNSINIGTIIQQFSIGLGVLFAMGGFQGLLTFHGVIIKANNHWQIIVIYKQINNFLAALMLLNLLTPFNFKNFIGFVRKDQRSNLR